MKFDHIKVPSDGQRISVNTNFSLNVPDRPIVRNAADLERCSFRRTESPSACEVAKAPLGDGPCDGDRRQRENRKQE